MADPVADANAAVQAAFNKMAEAKRRGDQSAFMAANSELSAAQTKQAAAVKSSQQSPSNPNGSATATSPLSSFFGYGR